MARHRYDLIYFNIYAYAEPIKMLMAHRGLDWHYHMPWDFFGKAWDEAKPEVAFGELPVLVIDGAYMLWESAAILRYLADGALLIPSDARARARVDAILDSTKRFVMPVDATVNIRQGNASRKKRPRPSKKCQKCWRRFFASWSNQAAHSFLARRQQSATSRSSIIST